MLSQFNSGPLPPSVNIEVDCSNNHSSLPSILATLTAQHRWPEYPITNFSINITNNSNEFLLKETIFPYTADTSKSIMIDITNLLPTSFDVSDYICSTLVVSTSAVSEVYGEGEPDKHDVMIFRRKFVAPVMNVMLLLILCTYTRTAHIKY